MKVSVVTDQDREQLLEQRLGVELASLEEQIAELLRSELAARGVSGRRSLCDRVVLLLESVAPVELEIVKEILSSLERAGDVSSGPQGRVAATPLRAVKLAENKYQFYGTVSCQQLEALFAKSRLSVGVTRVLNVKGENRQEFPEILDKLKGVELTPEHWAGLDKVGAANQEWLDGLNDRLGLQPQAAGSFDMGATRGQWQVYQPDKAALLQKDRWQKEDSAENGNLWRIWHERGWPMFCWTNGGSPEQVEHLRLSADDANRTMFALDRVNDAKVSCKISEKKKYTQVQVGGFLPKAEYRYLVTKGKFIAKDGDYFCFQFKNAIWTEVSDLLTERLGIPGKTI